MLFETELKNNNIFLEWSHQQKDVGRKPPDRGDFGEHCWEVLVFPQPHNPSQRKGRFQPQLGPQLCALREALLNGEVDSSQVPGKSQWACRFTSTRRSSECWQSHRPESRFPFCSWSGPKWAEVLRVPRGGPADTECCELREEGGLKQTSHPERSKDNLVLGMRLPSETVCETKRNSVHPKGSLKSGALQDSKMAHHSPNWTKY